MNSVTSTVVPFFHHGLGQEVLDSIGAVLKGPILTTGKTVADFEERFAEMLGTKHALGVTSCTGALHMSLLALGIGEGDEVITTPMTFIATATSILEAGAKPVFIDVEPHTGNLDASKIEAAITKRTKAIMPVHLYGQMCDMRAIRAIADKHNLFVIEDAAHCVEGLRDGVGPGTLGDTACFSFYATKNLTCGEGGAVVTNNTQVYEKLKLLRTHGMTKTAADRAQEGYKHWDMLSLGWKYNMDNLQAAMLLPQMDRLNDNWNKRAILAKSYVDKLATVSGIAIPTVLPGVKHAHHLFPILVKGGMRDQVIAALQNNGVSVMVNYRAIHLLTYFAQTMQHNPGDFPIAESFGDSVLSLPFYPSMPPEHIDVVTSILRGFLKP